MKSEQIIFVEPIDVRKWAIFQQYYDPFTIMIDYGVFQVKNGAVSLHFDNVGTLQNIQRADVLYSRKHTTTVPIPRQ